MNRKPVVPANGAEYFKFFADHLPDILYVFNMESKQMEFISSSVERMTGYTAEEMMRMPRDKVFSKETFERFHLATVERLELIKERKQVSQIHVDELVQFRKDGSTFYAEFSNHYTVNSQGVPIVIGIIRDITDRKLLQQSLAEKLVEQQRREEAERELARVREAALIREVQEKHDELVSSLVTISSNNHMANELLAQITKTIRRQAPGVHAAITDLVHAYKKKHFTANWDTISRKIESASLGFDVILKDRCPSLSKRERQLCALIMLDVTNADIANFTFSTYDAVRKARARIRKKLRLSPEIDLTQYLQGMNFPRQ